MLNGNLNSREKICILKCLRDIMQFLCNDFLKLKLFIFFSCFFF